MKTRIIKTRAWGEDEKFGDLTSLGKLLFLYLITNPRVGMTNYYECPDKTKRNDTDLNKQQLEEKKAELSAVKMAFFKEAWVFIPNLEKHNNYRNGKSNEVAYHNELLSIPSEIKSFLDSTVDGTVHSTYKQEVINKNTKVINKKEEIGKENEDRGKAFLTRWNEAHKTKYTAWKPISENLEYWLEQYTPEQILQAVKNLALDDFWKDKMTPTIFLRQKNRHGEAVDYIGQLSQKKRRAVVGL